MTPEKAQYHLLMLRLGQRDAYEGDLDRILEQEDPLSPLVLELALCMSDTNKTISVLREYLCDHPADQQAVYHTLLSDLRRRYEGGEWDALQTAGFLWEVQQVTWDFGDEPWDALYSLTHEFELFEEGLISRAVFEDAFESLFLRGIRLDVWAMEAARQPKKRKSILDLFRRKGDQTWFTKTLPTASTRM